MTEGIPQRHSAQESPQTEAEMLAYVQKGVSAIAAAQKDFEGISFEASDASLAELNQILTETHQEMGEQEKTGTFLRMMRNIPGFGTTERKLFDMGSVDKKQENIRERMEKAMANVLRNIEPLEKIATDLSKLILDIEGRIQVVSEYLQKHPNTPQALYFQTHLASLNSGHVALQSDLRNLQINIQNRKAYWVKMQTDGPVVTTALTVAGVTEQANAEVEQAALAARALMGLNDALTARQMKSTRQLVRTTTDLLSTHPLSEGTMQTLVEENRELEQELRNRNALIAEANKRSLNVAEELRLQLQNPISAIGYLPDADSSDTSHLDEE